MMDQTKQGLVGLAPRRKAAGYTQAGLAVALDVSRSLLAAWEVGNLWPSSERLPRMAQLLGCTIAELYAPPEPRAVEGAGPYEAPPEPRAVEGAGPYEAPPEPRAVEGAGPYDGILTPEGGDDHAGELPKYLS